MSKASRRKRHRILALIAAGAMALVVVLIVAIVVVVLRRPETPPTAVPPTAVPPTAVPPTTKKPRPEFQSADCPDVQLMSIPGTWESSPVLDPFNPTQFPIALLLNVSNPIRQQFDNGRLEVFTVPYTAQFHNPFSADKQRQPGRGHAGRGEGDDGHEQPLPADQLCPRRLLAGRGDRR